MAAREGEAWTGLLTRDRALILAGLGGLLALTWLDTLRRAWGSIPVGAMADMSGCPMGAGPWGPVEAATTAAMWVTMMAAMMLPSAAPVLLVFAGVNRRRAERGNVGVPTAVFLLGYLLVWSGFSLAAAGAQWGLHNLTMLSGQDALVSRLAGGLVLIAAGVYQLTPLKRLCLVRCQSPLDFLLTRWRDGAGGALRMGLAHGLYCVGCCWVLMALLFVGGVMNLTWIALLAAFVLAEKALARGLAVSRLAGLALVAWGLATALAG